MLQIPSYGASVSGHGSNQDEEAHLTPAVPSGRGDGTCLGSRWATVIIVVLGLAVVVESIVLVWTNQRMDKGVKRNGFGLEWAKMNKMPPWLSNIKEGSTKGVVVMLGQSMRPDGSASKVMLDRAAVTKQLIDTGKADVVIACGGDPAAVGRTEAYTMMQFLIDSGIREDKIMLEPQSLDTAENAWFALRWIPKGTGQLFLVTSDFHMPRASYIFKITLKHFYKKCEDTFADYPKHGGQRYPRLAFHEETVTSFCGSDAALSRDGKDGADITSKSLANRAMQALRWMGSMEVSEAFYGPPKRDVFYIWGEVVDVAEHPGGKAELRRAIDAQVRTVQGLCQCKAPPEGDGPAIEYPLAFPIDVSGGGVAGWEQAIESCTRRT